MDVMNVNEETYPFEDKAQIFEIKTNAFIKELDVSIPHDLWQQYFNQFKWLAYKDGILHCWNCEEAYKKFPNELECDEWTSPSQFSYKSINKNNLILILKLHNFSNNHIHASEFISQILEIDNSPSVTISSLENSIHNTSVNLSNHFRSITLKHKEVNKNSEFVELLKKFSTRHFETFSKKMFPDCVIDLENESNSRELLPLYLNFSNGRSSHFNLWGRYLSRYPWLYLKDSNPGCKYCEQAFKMSLQMSFTKWTSPNVLSENVSQDRPNRTLLQHDRSKNHRIAEDVLIEHGIIEPRVNSDAIIEEEPISESVLKINLPQPNAEYPPNFDVERWDRFTKNYPWLYYGKQLFHCTYCERAFTIQRNRMTNTSWTSSQFDSSRIKDLGKARHYFYDHQRSNNHRVARNILQLEGIVSTKSSVADEDDYMERMSNSDDEPRIFEGCIELMRPLSPYEELPDKILNDKQWEQLCTKYPWLVGAMGKSYGCNVCQQGRQVDPVTVNISQWTQGCIQFTKTKYIQLRKSLWCHSITRNHINSVSALQQSKTILVNGDHSKLDINGIDQSELI